MFIPQIMEGVAFCVAQLPQRTFPPSLPAWMVVLDSTLGSRLGTLYKAPRNSERPTQDSNVFTKNDFWKLHACKPSTPLPLNEYVTPESGTFFSNKSHRSHCTLASTFMTGV